MIYEERKHEKPKDGTLGIPDEGKKELEVLSRQPSWLSVGLITPGSNPTLDVFVRLSLCLSPL